MPATLHLCLLGPFQAELDSGDGPRPLPPLPTRPARALLARLALAHPAPLPRARLVEDLFPGSEAERSAHHLRTTLYYLRRAHPGLPGSSDAQIWLDRELILDVDVLCFEQASQPSAARPALEEAARLYRGPFLESPAEGWAVEEARRLHNRYIDVLRRLVAFSQAGGCLADGLEAARRWAAEEPWEIKAHQALIAALAAVGDREAAEAQVARARQILDGEWGQLTDPEFEALARQVKGLPAGRPAAASTASESAPGQPAARAAQTDGVRPSQIQFDRLPLIDRAAELDRLWKAWMRARHGDSDVVVLEGPAGVGKTRLVSELAARARLQAGSLVLWGVADDATVNIPLGLLRDAFTRLSPAEVDRVRQPYSGLDPVIRGVLRKIVPELGQALAEPEGQALPDLDGPAEGARRQAALSALSQALTAQGPLLLVLENAHKADEETLTFLENTLGACHQNGGEGALSGCLGVLTSRPGFSAARAAGLNWPVTRLAPLDEADMRALLRQALGTVESGEVLERIAKGSGGNPLFAREILRTLVEQGRLFWDKRRGWQLLRASIPLPDPVADLLTQRLAGLSASARRLATLLAVLGRPAEEPLLDTLFAAAGPAQNPGEGRLAAQAELLERQVLVEQSERLWFDHDWLRETLLASLDAPTRAALHGQVGLALERQASPDRVERMQHRLEAGLWEPALEDGLCAAESALNEQNLQQLWNILQALARALEQLDLPPGDTRRWRYLRLAERYFSRAEHGPAWRQALNDLLAFADAARQELWRVEALIRRASALYILGEFENAVQAGRKAVQAACVVQSVSKEAEARELLVSMFFDWGKLDEAWPECEALLAAAQASQEERLQCLALNGLVQVNILQGKVEEAMVMFARLAEHPYMQKHSDWEMMRQMAIFSMAGRAYEAGLAWLRASAQRAQQVGDVIGMVRSEAYLCFELANLGRYAEVQAIGEGVLPLAGQLKDFYQEGFLCYALAKAALYGQQDPIQALELVERGIARTEPAGLMDPLTGLLGLEAQICLAQGWPARAQAAIERAEGLSAPSSVVFVDHIAAAVWMAQGQREKACGAAQQAVAQAHDLGFLAVWADEMLWTAAQVLEQAEGPAAAGEIRRRAYRRFADDLSRLDGPAARRQFIQANPAHGDLIHFPGDGSCRITWLPEPGAPTGRPLRPHELAPVVWERDAPGEPSLDSPAGRKARLERLCRAALDQGAVATLEALADFLAASPRTLQRDLRALRDAGVQAQTRGGIKNKDAG